MKTTKYMANTINKRTKITLTATPKEGYRFISWSNGITDNPYTTTVGNIIGQENRIEPIYILEDSSIIPIGDCASNEIKYISQSKIDIKADADPRLYCKIVSNEYDNITHYGCITFSEDVEYIPDTFFNNSYILKLSLPNTLKYIKMFNAKNNIGILDIKNVNNNAIINVKTYPNSWMINYIIHDVNEEIFVENGMFYTDNTKTDLIAVDNSVYEITIGGNSIQNIRRNCFKYFNNSLTSVVINDCSIISNENNYGMFGSCTGIRTIIINDTNTAIHEFVFDDMEYSGISILMYYEYPPFMPKRTGSFFTSSAWVQGTIYVPDQYLSNYLNDSKWKQLNIKGLSTYQESQSGSGLDSTNGSDEEICPQDEIWYTSNDNTIVTPYNSSNPVHASIISNTYENNKGIIKFDRNITLIGNEFFKGCNKLTSVVIPNSILQIGYHAFYGCTRLTTFNIPYSVAFIGDYAFYNVPHINGPAELSGAPWGARSMN